MALRARSRLGGVTGDVLGAGVEISLAAARTEELTQLWGRATADEQRLLTGILLGELRIGALEGVLTDAVAKAAGRLSLIHI